MEVAFYTPVARRGNYSALQRGLKEPSGMTVC